MKNRAIDRGLDPRSGNSQPPRLFVWTPDSSCGSHQYYQLATHLSGAREEQGWAFWTLKDPSTLVFPVWRWPSSYRFLS